jgi:cardiolipin synthase A/B
MDIALQPAPVTYFEQRRRPAFLSREFSANKVRLIHGGREYFELLKKMISDAKETIHLQTYIFDVDETGEDVANDLIKAAQRNVNVYLLVDGYASQSLSPSFIDRLRSAGVNFRFFQPIFKSKSFYFGRRLHHKMLVVDDRCAVVGGINISKRYNDGADEPAWLDFAIYVEGPVAKDLCVLGYKMWSFPKTMHSTPCESRQTQFELDVEDRAFVRMCRNDWVRRKKQITLSYINMLKKAKHEVTILSSYFLPGHEFAHHLIRAARRGVKIRIIMAGRSDVKIAKHAERFLYQDLLDNNIEIYEYQKTILHGKVTVCDNKWVTIGSYNVNNISAYASIELNLEVYAPNFAKCVDHMLQEIAHNDCIQITTEWMEKKETFFARITQWVCYETIRLIFYLFTFYFKQQG